MPGFDPPSAASSIAALNANTYSDVNGLESLKQHPRSPRAIHAVAEQVDALFLQMMLKSMREAAEDTGDPQSNELGMYQDLFDKQVALSISQRGGLGIGAMIARQLEAGAAAASATAAAAASQPGGAAAPARTTASASGAASIAENAAAFVGRVLPAIRTAAQALGVSPIGLLAQAALETGWGRRMARTANGAPSLNLFGIKADEHWTGARAAAPTVEFSNGIGAMRTAAFRAYGSIEESVADFARLLRQSPRYRQAIAAGGDIQGYIQGIAGAGYATDPGYADKLNEIVHSGVFRAALRSAAVQL